MLNFKVNGFIMSLGLSKLVIQSIMFYLIFSFDWKKINPKNENSSQNLQVENLLEKSEIELKKIQINN